MGGWIAKQDECGKIARLLTGSARQSWMFAAVIETANTNRDFVSLVSHWDSAKPADGVA